MRPIFSRRPARAAALAVMSLLAAGCGEVAEVPADAAGTGPDAASADPDATAADGAAAPDGAVPFPDDPVVYLPLDGDYSDQSGNGNEASGFLNPEDSLFGVDRFGSAREALDLSENLGDATDYNLLVTPDLGLREDMTAAVWVNASDPQGDRIAGVGEWFGLVRSSGEVAFGLTSGSDSVEPLASDSAPVPEGTWTFYAGVVEVSDDPETTVTLYRDGEMVAEASAGEYVDPPPEECGFYVGSFRTGTDQCSTDLTTEQKFAGLVDDVRVYDRALSAAEIDKLYREGGWPEN